MELILKKDIPELGFKNDIINVKNGYGRNYLIPNKFAIIANDSNKKILRENLKQTTHKIEKIKNDATKLSNRIGDLILDIPVKVGKEKKIFGNVTKNQISNLLEEKKFSIDKKNISINGKIGEIGEYSVNLILHKDITHQIKINLVEEKGYENKTTKKETKKKTKESKKKDKKK
tara:strand:- start:8 stop:529 length:522 start_codon:yes stop_codon:yes gene_type:complete